VSLKLEKAESHIKVLLTLLAASDFWIAQKPTIEKEVIKTETNRV
jgi:hypothetical protein